MGGIEPKYIPTPEEIEAARAKIPRRLPGKRIAAEPKRTKTRPPKHAK